MPKKSAAKGPKKSPAPSGGAGGDYLDILPTVAIGSSAGGVSALQTLFQRMPPDLGVAFVVVAHLEPSHPSELVPILQRRTTMPVHQVEQKMPLKANCVYVIPPDRRLFITDGDISSMPFDEPRGQRAPIDLFFRSLAEQHGDGFAIVLSGAGSDGVVGVRAIKEAGGVILVQDPKDAEYSSMPRHAIATGVADVVAPISEIPERLTDLVRNKHRIQSMQKQEDEDASLRRILAFLRARTGHDFSQYKRPTIMRRLTRRMQLNRIDRLEGYAGFLRENAEEIPALFSDLLISVTTFFRDPEAFDSLADRVLPHFSTRSATARASASGSPAARQARRPTPSRSCCWKRRRAEKYARRFRFSPLTSTPARSRRRARAASPARSKPMFPRSGCGASSRAKAITTACAKRCATSSCSPRTAC